MQLSLIPEPGLCQNKQKEEEEEEVKRSRKLK